ncbi:MAG: pyridoxamine 5'-phosphate oxidase [Thermoleophilia bacterium]|nr:pyridoxamine 5'-phosphate oxidase [Thermoleophilia bacterium]
MRVEYTSGPLAASALGSDPMAAFSAWFASARAAASARSGPEANAMTVATVAADGTPSARMVLLKDVDAPAAAFTWYTNLASRKAIELAVNDRAALCWWWPGEAPRQVRAVGRVTQVDRATSADYFNSRPLGARIGAAASHQSRAVAHRTELDERTDAIDPANLELPEDWGGLRLVADELEFWQGRTGRLHDRITFLRLDDAGEPYAASAVAGAGGIEMVRAASTEVIDPAGTRWWRVRLEP